MKNVSGLLSRPPRPLAVSSERLRATARRAEALQYGGPSLDHDTIRLLAASFRAISIQVSRQTFPASFFGVRSSF
jgi:hypothetical protein